MRALPTTGAALGFVALLWLRAINPETSGIHDADFFWHLAYGKLMIETGAIPAVDTWSWTFAGKPYQLTQWLGELVMGLTYESAGLTGTAALATLLTAITLGFGWAAARRSVDTVSALVLTACCGVIFLVAPMRPQLFSFALLAVVVYLLLSWQRKPHAKYLAALPFIMAVWVNLHGGYVVGLAAIALFGAGILWDQCLVPRRMPGRREWMFAGAAVAALLATLINPYGFGAWTIVLEIGGLRSSEVISEWMAVNLTSGVGWFYLMAALPYFAMLILGARPNASSALLAAFVLIFGYAANRQVPFLAAAMPGLLAALVAQLPQYQKIRVGICDRRRPLVFAGMCITLALSGGMLHRTALASLERSESSRLPVAATEFVIEHRVDERVLSDSLDASYLIHRGVPVFVDGRMDLYLDEFYFKYYLASKGAPGWLDLLEEHKPTALLLRNAMALRQLALADPNWSLVFDDGTYSVLVPARSATGMPMVPPAKVNYLDKDGGLSGRYRP